MEQQIAAFVLGVSAVVFVWGIVVAFRTARKVSNIETSINDIYQVIRENDEMVNRRIDQEIDRVDQLYRECNSYINSRVDKLESKIITREILKG